MWLGNRLTKLEIEIHFLRINIILWLVNTTDDVREKKTDKQPAKVD